MAEDAIRQKFIIEVDGQGKVKAYSDSLKQLENDTAKAEKSQSNLGSTLKKMAAGYITVATAIKGAKLAIELGELGANVEVVNKNFQQFANRGGRDAIAMMGQLRKASGGMMDDMFLQQQAMKAMISGIKFDDMIVAMEYVRKYAIATGSDVNQKMETVMTGLARGSAQFMDDVGIQVMGAKDVVGATIDQMKQKMGEFADTSDSSATKINMMKTSFESLRQEIGTALSPVLGELATILTDTANGFIQSGDLAKLAAKSFVLVSKTGLGIVSSIELIGNTVAIEMARAVYWMARLEEFRQKNETSIGGDPKKSKRYLEAKAFADEAKRTLEYAKEGRNDDIVKRGAQLDALSKSIDSVAKSNDNLMTSMSGGSITGGVSGIDSDKVANERAKAIQEEADMELRRVEYLFSIGEEAKRLQLELQKENRKLLDTGMSYDVMPSRSMMGEDKLLPYISDTSELDTSLSGFKDYWNTYGQIAQAGLQSLGDIMGEVNRRQLEEIQMGARAEIDAVNASTKSRQQKAKEIAKINKNAEAEAKKIRQKEWAAQLTMAIANTAMGMTNILASPPTAMSPTQRFAMAAAAGILGATQVGIIASNKPRYYYGSKDASSQYREVGGNSSGDAISAQVKSGELIVRAGKDAQTAKAALNGGMSNVSNSIMINAPVTVSGNADRNTAVMIGEEISRQVARVIENRKFTNNINPAFA